MSRPGALDTAAALSGWEASGEQMLQCISDRDFDTLATLFDPAVTCRLLVPSGLQTPGDAPALMDTMRGWFEAADRFHVEESYTTRVVDRLHVGYRIRLREEGLWYRLEQQTYSTFVDGRITHFDLICSGFRLDDPQAEINGGAFVEESAAMNGDDSLPRADALLEVLQTGGNDPSACARLTPSIKASLKELAPGQVLQVRVDDPSATLDVTAWCNLTGNRLEASGEQDGIYTFYIRKKAEG